jgi:hypothetical protein
MRILARVFIWGVLGLCLLAGVGIATLDLLGERRAGHQRAQLADDEKALAAELGIQRIEDCAPPAVGSTDNRWPLYVRAAAMLEIPKPKSENDTPLINELLAAVGRGQRVAEARALLAANQEPLRVFEAAAELPAANLGIDYRHGLGWQVPDLMDQMLLAKLEALWGRLGLVEGSPATAARSIRALRAQAETLRQEPVLVALIVARSIEIRQLWLLHALVEEPPVDEESLESARAQVDHDDLAVRIRRTLACEYLGYKISDEEPSRREHADFPCGLLKPWYRSVRLDVRHALATLALAEARESHVPYAVLRQRPPLTVSAETAMGGRIARLLQWDWRGEIAKIDSLKSLRDLAEVAADLRLVGLHRGTYDIEGFKPPQERVSGTTATMQAQPDGSFIIEFTADLAWQEAWLSKTARSLCHWRLPPPVRPAAGYASAERPEGATER